MSNAYEKFENTFQRSYGMIERHYQIFHAYMESEDDEEWQEEDDDLFRAGIVLAVSAMDSYYTDRFCEALIPYMERYGTNKNLMKLLHNSGFDTELAIDMFNKSRPKRILSNLVRKRLRTFVTQNFRTIDNLYKCLGYNRSFTNSAQGIARRKTLVKSVDTIIKRRHKIVHSGDYNTHGKLNPIAYSTYIRKMDDIEKLVKSSESLLKRKKIYKALQSDA